MMVCTRIICCYLGDRTQEETYMHTCTLSHIRESAPKVEREGRGGGSPQSDISSWVPATAWKCHITRPDTSIKAKESFPTVDSKRIITSLHHPLRVSLFTRPVFFCICKHPPPPPLFLKIKLNLTQMENAAKRYVFPHFPSVFSG